VEISSYLVKHPETGQPLCVATVQHDMTERDQLQRQLVQADKLAAIGTLISGVAHEVNNPLAGASGRAELLLLENHEEGLKNDLQVILDEIRRAGQIMRNLLSFAREHQPERTPTVINELIESVLVLLAYEFRVNKVEIRQDLDNSLPMINVDPNQLRQVFLNLVVNAQHAVSDSEQPRVISASTRVAGDAVHAVISDTGTGIPKANLDKIFDPFFTTKPGKQGTGLGLSICFGIVQEHGGVIRAESEAGKGATFTVELPINGQS
jgi:two-component system NtrC family sensor kinase